MKFEIDQDTKKRTDKAIANVRLIASRVKRAKLLEAVQQGEAVVSRLNNFRQYVNAVVAVPEDQGTLDQAWQSLESVSNIMVAAARVKSVYTMLTREKQKSYEEEYKQVDLLFADILEYFTNTPVKGDEHAPL